MTAHQELKYDSQEKVTEFWSRKKLWREGKGRQTNIKKKKRKNRAHAEKKYYTSVHKFVSEMSRTVRRFSQYQEPSVLYK